jgi:hypothetical protein
MDDIKFYNMHGINCWIINLKPFGPDASDTEIRSLQDECVKKCIFGMGWSANYFKGKQRLKLTDVIEEYKTKCEEYYDNKDSAKNAVDQMFDIKCGDLAIMRLRNGHTYLGRVTETPFHDNTLLKGNNLENLSWVCRVEKWLEFGDESEIPSEIAGRFSQRQQATITRIADYKQRLLMLAMYETASNGKTDVPKIILNENNFTRALNYMDLEDLVCSYIYNRHYEDGYMLLPSSGKVSRLKYEFTFISNKSNKKPITCQVKNQNNDSINIANYENDKENYEKIYLFSGNDNFENRELAKDNIEIISHHNLFEVLQNLKYMHEKLKKYHSFCKCVDLDEIQKILAEKGWQNKKSYRNNCTDFKKYKLWNHETGEIGWMSFGYNGFYITDEFDSFIIEWQDKNTETIKAQLEKDLK